MARLFRRIAALVIDWGLSSLLSFAFFQPDPFGFATLGIFIVSQVIFVMTTGASIGHRVLGLRVVPVGGGIPGVWRPLVRTLLIAVVIPAVIWDKDERGMHDRVAGTVLVRR